MGLQYDPSYRETVTLRDGTTALLRMVTPEDKKLFVEGFTRLSPESRYLRFFTGKDQLTERELRYLTEVDGDRHFAIGAIGPDGAGLGVARFVRLAEGSDVAEMAVTVVDAMQHKGLGRILCERLVYAARERGVKSFRAEVLASNAAMLAIIEGQGATSTREGAAIVVDFPLPAEPAVAPPGSLFSQLLELAAKRLLSFRRAFDRLMS